MEFKEIEVKGLGWSQAKREYQAEVRRLYLKYCDKVLKSHRNDEIPWGTINAYTYGIYALNKKDLLKAYDYWKGLTD